MKQSTGNLILSFIMGATFAFSFGSVWDWGHEQRFCREYPPKMEYQFQGVTVRPDNVVCVNSWDYMMGKRP
jgi:hypothetical protein